MFSNRQRARFRTRDKNENLINTQIQLLKEFRPYVKSLLPTDCVTCENCKKKRALEQEKNFQDILRRVSAAEEKSKLQKQRRSVLPSIQRCKSAGKSRKLSQEHWLNPRLVTHLLEKEEEQSKTEEKEEEKEEVPVPTTEPAQLSVQELWLKASQALAANRKQAAAAK